MITRRSARRAATLEEPQVHPANQPSPSKDKYGKKTEKRAEKKDGKRAGTRGAGRRPEKVAEKIVEKEVEKEVEKVVEKRAEKRKAGPNENALAKKTKLSPINFNFDDPEPVVEYLKESLKVNKIRPNVGGEILDQIALEGLSGITLSKLFRILDAQTSNFNCLNDQNCRNYVWSVIINQYLPRGLVQVFYLDPNKKNDEDQSNDASTKGVIIEEGIQLHSQTTKRHAKIDSLLHPVQDGFIMGSCYHYLSRVNITQELICYLEKEGSEASMHSINDKYGLQNIYFVANQTIRSRAVLPEWADPNADIKLREYCALELIGKSRTLGTTFPNDKALGRYRIMLVAKGFITQYQETFSSPVEHHLIRFSSNLDSIHCKTYTTTNAATEESDDDEDNDGNTLTSSCCDPHKLKADRSILSMVYDVIAESPKALAKYEIRRKLNMPKFHIRNHLKNLVSLRMICSFLDKANDKQIRRYKTSHKIMRKERKIKKVEELEIKPTGIMANWDEADLRAKKMIGHKRSSFTQSEDSLLILCRIASILLDPTSNISWCVNKRVIRDLLHSELVESHDKTSDACLRRIKYLKRLPNNIMSINELTAELRDDPDIRRLTKLGSKITESDDKFKKLFVQVLKIVKIKIPNLLGISVATSSTISSLTASSIARSNLRKVHSVSASSKKRFGTSLLASSRSVTTEDGQNNSETSREKSIKINDHEELNQKYELVDCQSVASILRPPTYEEAKNVVDVKFNNASLVTMAFTLSSCLSNTANSTQIFAQTTSQTTEQQQQQGNNDKRAYYWLLEKFYLSYHDKLISSMISKLNKRSLLTRKCPAEHASMYKPKTKTSLKLNQSVLFLLSRYHSGSLIQLAHPIGQLYNIDLSESNEMASIAMLTSLYSMRSSNLNLRLKIPINVVNIDQGNENFKEWCKKANEDTRDILARFMSRCGVPLISTKRPEATTTSRGATKTIASTSLLLGGEVGLMSQSSSSSGGVAKKSKGTSLLLNKNNNKDDRGQLGDVSGCVPSKSLTTNILNGSSTSNNKMDDSRRALFLLRHELKAHALDKHGNLADCLVVQPCNVKFYSDKAVSLNKEPLEEFLDKAKPSDLIDVEQQQQEQQQQEHLTKWLVRSYRLPSDKDLTSEKEFEANKIPIEYSARLWKRVDGSVHILTLFKLIESLLSTIIVHPGVERDSLESDFEHLMPSEHLFELLELMENLRLISRYELKQRKRKPRLFGYITVERGEKEGATTTITYEATEEAYVKYCQLLGHYSRHEEQCSIQIE